MKCPSCSLPTLVVKFRRTRIFSLNDDDEVGLSPDGTSSTRVLVCLHCGERPPHIVRDRKVLLITVWTPGKGGENELHLADSSGSSGTP